MERDAIKGGGRNLEKKWSKQQRSGVKERLVTNRERERKTINRQNINPIRLTRGLVTQ